MFLIILFFSIYVFVSACPVVFFSLSPISLFIYSSSAFFFHICRFSCSFASLLTSFPVFTPNSLWVFYLFVSLHLSLIFGLSVSHFFLNYICCRCVFFLCSPCAWVCMCECSWFGICVRVFACGVFSRDRGYSSKTGRKKTRLSIFLRTENGRKGSGESEWCPDTTFLKSYV